MTETPPPDWLNADELAAKMQMSPRWVKDRWATGELPSVKVGGVRFWTPGCMAELERRNGIAAEPTPEETWGRVPRRGRGRE